MIIVSAVKAFCYRKYSASYRNEMEKVSGFEEFSQLANEVKDQQGNKAALLAIQDFAYGQYTQRLKDFRNANPIGLMVGEEPVGSERCKIGAAKCMKEIYLQTKNLRHGYSADRKTNSKTFRALNIFGRVFLNEYELPKEEEYNSLTREFQEAYQDRMRTKLRRLYSGRTTTRFEAGLIDALDPWDYDEGGHGGEGAWGDYYRGYHGTYSDLQAAAELLQAESPPPYEQPPSEPPPSYGDIYI